MVPRYFESFQRKHSAYLLFPETPRGEAGQFQWLLVSVSPQVLAFCVFDICFVHGWVY